MSGFSQASVCNNLLQNLSDAGFSAIAPHLERVDLPSRRKLANPRCETDWVYFLDSGIASVIGQGGGLAQEVAMIGNEGAGCLSVVLAAKPAPYLIVMQFAGEGHRLRVDTLATLIRVNEDVQDVMLRFARASLYQIAQNALANTQLNTAQRLARWLLMVRDRIGRPVVEITHENLAYTLGVGRTSITLALRVLLEADLIANARGAITLLDGPGLTTMSGGCYGPAEAEYDRLFHTAPMGPARQPAMAGHDELQRSHA